MSMLTNLFSMFDPSSYSMSSCWMTIWLPSLMVMKSKMKSLSKNNFSIKNFLMKIYLETSQSSAKNFVSSKNLITSLLTLFFFLNLISLTQYIFTPTAHMSVNFSICLTLWISLVMWSISKNSKNLLIHLTPMSTPTPLMNFMVMIELVSNLIRPITLSVRMSANMVAGHLLLSLLSNFSMKKSMIYSFIPLMILILLEMSVAFIQAYVLSTLLSLYQSEATN